MTLFFQKFAALSTGIRVSSWRRETVVFAAILILGVFAAALLVIDGYVWYLSYLRDPASIAPARRNAILTEQDIDAALILLDEQEKRMHAVLLGM